MMLQLRFGSKAVKKPIISLATLETSTLLNIIKANVGPREGELIIEVDDSKAEQIVNVFTKYGVDVHIIERAVEKDEEKCIHCGACISICPVEAIELNGEKKVVINASKCIHCGNCVNVCPVKALKLP
ncbi:4Fe-4S binding protein [Archaeoglobus veneficus]|uniref:4Fe-4S ferredoxin iron-sulfur binding domain-containing protein n=1 Tax=Archaeoglobus veneficus (strain DSM 11195 / SNP6) TaxID=693661 RepID=F2KT64_ARCVS|nr:4Fe-4S binding protein [Archaeoglobus veneficus]AEA47094.1 4Fe-4S ferredoxin iron-sulfur binding domain-containing protein [Archaeoglobus veneficus SNP6]